MSDNNTYASFYLTNGAPQNTEAGGIYLDEESGNLYIQTLTHCFKYAGTDVSKRITIYAPDNKYYIDINTPEAVLTTKEANNKTYILINGNEVFECEYQLSKLTYNGDSNNVEEGMDLVTKGVNSIHYYFTWDGKANNVVTYYLKDSSDNILGGLGIAAGSDKTWKDANTFEKTLFTTHIQDCESSEEVYTYIHLYDTSTQSFKESKPIGCQYYPKNGCYVSDLTQPTEHLTYYIRDHMNYVYNKDKQITRYHSAKMGPFYYAAIDRNSNHAYGFGHTDEFKIKFKRITDSDMNSIEITIMSLDNHILYNVGSRSISKYDSLSIVHNDKIVKTFNYIESAIEEEFEIFINNPFTKNIIDVET